MQLAAALRNHACDPGDTSDLALKIDHMKEAGCFVGALEPVLAFGRLGPSEIKHQADNALGFNRRRLEPPCTRAKDRLWSQHRRPVKSYCRTDSTVGADVDFNGNGP